MTSPADFQLLKYVDTNVVGIFWQTSDSLKQRPAHFMTLDYLFNGLLSMHLKNENHQNMPSKHSNFFVSTNFGKSIYLGHYNSNDNQQDSDAKTMAHLIELTKGLENEHKKILVLSDNAVDLKKKFNKSYPKFKFISL